MAFSPFALFGTLVPKDRSVWVVRDVAYGPDDRHRLDVYRPRAEGIHPIVMFFYGGGWASGERADYAFVGHALAARGYVAVIADYRLVPDVVYPDFVADTALATQWVAARGPDFGGDPRKLFLMGHSAGAYNVMMAALDPRFGIAPDVLAGVIGLSGPYDFYPFDVAASRNAFGSYPDPEVTQPIYHVSSHAPPILLIHGADDETVAPRNATALAERLEAAGAPVTLLLYRGAGHAQTLLALSRPLRWQYRVLEDVLEFLARHDGVERR